MSRLQASTKLIEDVGTAYLRGAGVELEAHLEGSTPPVFRVVVRHKGRRYFIDSERGCYEKTMPPRKN